MQAKKGARPFVLQKKGEETTVKWSLRESGSGMIGWRFRGSGCLKMACRAGGSGDDGAVSAIREGQDHEDSREEAVRSTTEIGKSRLERCGNRGRTGAMRKREEKKIWPVHVTLWEASGRGGGRYSGGRCYVLGVDDGSSTDASCMCNARLCPLGSVRFSGYEGVF